MSAAMTPEIAALLRAPFTADILGKLPRVWCGACRESRGKVCEKHRKVKCGICGNNITDAHLHLDYVGHAEATDRLLTVDPLWSWEPFAVDANGLPAVDAHGGLWIRLTVAGVTRIGYGHAEGKRGPDAVKEIIGDAIRNAAMRFGVALDLWGATFKAEASGEAEPPRDVAAAAPSAQQVRDWALEPGRSSADIDAARVRLLDQYPAVATLTVTNEVGEPEELQALLARLSRAAGGSASTAPHSPAGGAESQVHEGQPDASDVQHRRMHALWNDLGYGGTANRDTRLTITSKIVGREIATSKQLTKQDAKAVIDALEERKRAQA